MRLCVNAVGRAGQQPGFRFHPRLHSSPEGAPGGGRHGVVRCLYPVMKEKLLLMMSSDCHIFFIFCYRVMQENGEEAGRLGEEPQPGRCRAPLPQL